MIKIKSYKENMQELLKIYPAEDVELAVHCVSEGYFWDNLTRRELEDRLMRIYLDLEVRADGLNGITPNYSLFKYSKCCYCEFILETAYNSVEDERRRDIVGCFHEDDELQEAFLFNFEEDRLYRFTRQPDNSFIEEENSYSRRFKKNLREFFGTALEVMEDLRESKSRRVKNLSISAKQRKEEARRDAEAFELLENLLFKERCEQYAYRNNLDYLPISQDVHAWYSKRIYDKLSSEIFNNKDFKKDLLFSNAPVYSDSTGTLRTDIATFKYVLKPEDGNCPTFKYALWTVSIVGEEGLADAQKKMDDILKKVVTINEAFLFDPMTKKWMRYTRQENDSVIVEEKSYSRYLQKYMGSLL